MNGIRLGVFTFFAAFIIFYCVGKADAMALDGIDENGRYVKVYDTNKYLKQNPYKASEPSGP